MCRSVLFFLTSNIFLLFSHGASPSFKGELSVSTTDPSPKIEAFLPVENGGTDIGIVIFPDGGYRGLAEHEGAGYAHFFQSKGIAAFVVEYRLAPGGHKHPAMLEDALAAIETVRSRAEEFGIDPAGWSHGFLRWGPPHGSHGYELW